MTIETRIYDSNRAQEVLSNESFNWALESIKTEIVELWQNSPARDEKGREKLWQLLSMAQKLEATLRARLESGTLAKLELEHKQTLAERAKAFLA